MIKKCILNEPKGINYLINMIDEMYDYSKFWRWMMIILLMNDNNIEQCF